MIRRRDFVAATGAVTALATVSVPSFGKELGTVTEPGFALPAHATDCHSHIFDPEHFPYAADRRYTPPSATVDDLLRFHDRLGLQREVLVQPSVYGTDNACLLAALKRLGDRARGIAVIDKKVGRAQLEDMAGAGVRGIRINLEVSKSADPSLAIERLKQSADQLAGTDLVILVYAALPIIVACGPTMRTLSQRVLIDHFGLAKAAAGTSQPGFSDLLKILDSPNVHMKLSGPYQISKNGPDYADTTPIARALIDASPDCCVWGSDWPHTGGSARPANYKPTDIEAFRNEDDGKNLGLIKDWAPSAAQRQKLLVDNPARLFGFR